MPALLTQTDVRLARNLKFCYLCGQPFQCRADNHPDHVPAKAIFAKEDHNFPLKVAAHLECNRRESATDEILGQLISVNHGRQPTEGQRTLEFKIYNVEGFQTPFLGFAQESVASQIGRWLRGFHAALYEEFLPYETPSAIHPPFPHGKLTEDGFTIKDILDQQYLFVEIIKRNRDTRTLDRIVCNNGKLVYECVWVRLEGQWACVFGLQIYNWMNLADTHFPRRGCVGAYKPASGLPRLGTVGTNLLFTVPNDEPLDAFGA